MILLPIKNTEASPAPLKVVLIIPIVFAVSAVPDSSVIVAAPLASLPVFPAVVPPAVVTVVSP